MGYLDRAGGLAIRLGDREISRNQKSRRNRFFDESAGPIRSSGPAIRLRVQKIIQFH